MSNPVGKVTVGETYKLRRNGGCLYRVECLAYDPVHKREMVVYVGLNGMDHGKYYVCSPWDFLTKFEPPPAKTEEQAEPVPVPIKVAGVYTKGSGA